MAGLPVAAYWFWRIVEVLCSWQEVWPRSRWTSEVCSLSPLLKWRAKKHCQVLVAQRRQCNCRAFLPLIVPSHINAVTCARNNRVVKDEVLNFGTVDEQIPRLLRLSVLQHASCLLRGGNQILRLEMEILKAALCAEGQPEKACAAHCCHACLDIRVLCHL